MARWKMIHGGTHSRNAGIAEAEGEMPLTRAIDAVYLSRAKFWSYARRGRNCR
jgi:hypothetical protein